MVAKYTLKLINKYKDADFHFYASPPTMDALDMNVWFRATIPYDGSEQIQTDKNVYAWCGSIGGGGTATEGMTEPVTVGSIAVPGTTWKTAVVNGNALKFITAPPAASPGAFEINTGTDFSTDDKFMIGVAWIDPGDPTNLVPVKTFPAEPGTRYQFSTQPVFYVAAVRTDLVGLPQPATLPFGSWNFDATGVIGMNYGEITVKPDGTFSTAVYKKTHS